MQFSPSPKRKISWEQAPSYISPLMNLYPDANNTMEETSLPMSGGGKDG